MGEQLLESHAHRAQVRRVAGVAAQHGGTTAGGADDDDEAPLHVPVEDTACTAPLLGDEERGHRLASMLLLLGVLASRPSL